MSDESGRADNVDLLDFLVIVADNARLLIFGPIVAGLLALGITFVVPPTFTATTRLLPPQQRQSSTALLASQVGALAGLAGAAGLNIKNPTDTYVALIKSRTVADRLVERFRLLEVYDEDYREDARQELEKATRVKAGKDGLITIDVDDKDPERAAKLANAYVEELHKLTGSLAITEAQERRVFFEKQLKQTHENLKKAEVALSETGAGESLIKSAPQAVVETIARLRAQVTALEIQLSTMQGYLTESSPQFQLAQRQLASLRQQLSQAERDQPKKGNGGPNYLNRFRDYKYQETLFELMAKQYEVARLDEAREGAVIQIVDPAIAPERKSKPHRALIAVGTALATGVMLLIYVLVSELVRRSASDPTTSGKLARVASAVRRVFARE